MHDRIRRPASFMKIIYASPQMRRVMEIAERVGRTSSTVLILGECGTGKELIARHIHASGPRAEGPFVAINCGAIPTELLETELFGHVKGAFTGAHSSRPGRLESAGGGTVFLDEVSCLPAHMQVKLLRVLQEKSFERVGSNAPVKTDIRVIAASNVPLDALVRDGSFREDLYYRLMVVPIQLPPLRERTGDIALLATRFVERLSPLFSGRTRTISPEVIEILGGHHWPGNVRELENFIERLLVISSTSDEITKDDIPVDFFHCGMYENRFTDDLRVACREFERRFIEGVLEKTKWNRSRAADALNIHRNTLSRKIRRLGITELGRRIN